MDNLQAQQLDIDAIDQLVVAIGQLQPGTEAVKLMLRDIVGQMLMQKKLSEMCIQAATEQELRPRDWMVLLELTESDGGVYPMQEAA